MQPGRNRLKLTLIAALLSGLVLADAARAAVGAAPVLGAPADLAQARITDAVSALEQAALQADLASDAREAALLQRAHDDLSAARDQLHGTRRERTSALLQDLDQAIETTTVQLGALTGPLVPSRRLLAELADEAQDLQRQSPNMHRLPNTIIVGAGRPREPAAAGTMLLPDPMDEAQSMSWPLQSARAWPQIDQQF
jgi:hypothetical protein